MGGLEFLSPLRSYCSAKIEAQVDSYFTMVFKGQDAWRSHPMIAGQWRRPFPHLGLAIGIFTVGLAASKVVSYFTSE
jgi:hypothetical protein